MSHVPRPSGAQRAQHRVTWRTALLCRVSNSGIQESRVQGPWSMTHGWNARPAACDPCPPCHYQLSTYLGGTPALLKEGTSVTHCIRATARSSMSRNHCERCSMLNDHPSISQHPPSPITHQPISPHTSHTLSLCLCDARTDALLLSWRQLGNIRTENISRVSQSGL